MDRVLASRQFARSIKLSAFLRFVCDSAIDGAIAQVSEHNIGVRVFGRPPAYNPAEDNIVRSQARLLRQRLDAYFEGEGRTEALRISIPKGAYRPVFERRALDAAVGSAPPVAGARAMTRRRAMTVAASLAVSAGGYAVWPRAAESRSGALWQSIFNRTRSTLIVPADTGLVLAQDLAQQSVTLADYITGDYVAKLASHGSISSDLLRRIARRRYSGAVDVAVASRLMTRPEASSAKAMVRYSRDLRLAEFKVSNAILLGAPHSNPWLQLFGKKLNFWLDLDLAQSEFIVQNRSPRPGEQREYRTHLKDAQRSVWAVLSFLPNVDDAGRVLMLAGASTAGTEAAAEFLLNDDAMNAFLARSPASNGGPSYFNVLLEAHPVAGTAPQARPIAWRFL